MYECYLVKYKSSWCDTQWSVLIMNLGVFVFFPGYDAEYIYFHKYSHESVPMKK